MNRLAKVLPLLGIITGPAVAQNSAPGLDAYFSALSQHHRFNGTVLVAQEGNVVYERAFGFANFAAKKPNTPALPFPICSITKTVTATAVLQLQEQGKLQINDPVQRYLPTFPYPAITIRHLLSHTSGLPPYDAFFEQLRQAHPATVFTNRDVLPQFAALRLPLLYAPGASGNYDNINYIFLAILVEKVAGIPFADYLKSHIFLPARMTGVVLPHFAFYNYTVQEQKNLATTYYYPHYYSEELVRVDTVQFIAAYGHSYNFRGEGEIVCPARDLLRYDQALYGGKLLRTSTLQAAFTLGKLANGQVNPIRYGLGWVIEAATPFGRVVQHSGAAIGMRAILFRNIDKHQTVIIFDNTQNEVIPYAAQALKILNGQAGRAVGESAARVFGRVLVRQGTPAAQRQLAALQRDTAQYAVDENEFNALGYDLLNAHKMPEALAAFKVTAELFPASWNAYDSYGEALVQAGQKAEAIKMYQKSLALNPANEGGKKALAQLQK